MLASKPNFKWAADTKTRKRADLESNVGGHKANLEFIAAALLDALMKSQGDGPVPRDIGAIWNRFLHYDSCEKWQSSIGDVKRGQQQVSLQRHNRQVNGKLIHE
ncbi:hypothetical protein KCU77_g4747, partial [Aureobasidium melanogenum]